MKTTILSLLITADFAHQTFAQFAKTLTTDPETPGKLLYVPSPGLTSSVAAPNALPTLVYNCHNMPLICENVASWAKTVHPGGNGDLGQAQKFYFDPDETHKDRRRGVACGCFNHDGCSNAVSNGKQSGVNVQTIAKGGGYANALSSISFPNFRIILAGANPPRDPAIGRPTNSRVALDSLPGRFFAEGVAFSCDEFPAATFINGGTNAKTICALQSWQIFSGADIESVSKPGTWPNTGKWPLPPGSGIKMEQDWQAQSHCYLRSSFGIGSKAQNKGRGTVYPFFFTTTTIQQLPTKAYVVNSVLVTQIVNKRDESPTTTSHHTMTTIVVSGDLKEQESSENVEQSNATTGSRFAKVRAERAVQKAQSFTTCSVDGARSQCSTNLSDNTTFTDSSSTTKTKFSNISLSEKANSSSESLFGIGTFSLRTSTISSRLAIQALFPLNSTISSNNIRSFSSSLAIPNSSVVEPTILESDTPYQSSSTRSLQPAPAAIISTTTSVLSTTAHPSSDRTSSTLPLSMLNSTMRANTSLSIVTMYSLGAVEPTLPGISSDSRGTSSSLTAGDFIISTTESQISRRSRSLSSRISTDDSSSSLASTRIASQSSSGVLFVATISSIDPNSFASLTSKSSWPSVAFQTSASTLGSTEAAYSATAISKNVAAASSYALLLKADPSNKSKARAAQKSAHDSLNLALDMFRHSHRSSRLGTALSVLIENLKKSSSAADAAVDASTPEDEETDAEVLLSDLEEAAQDAEKVKEEEGNDVDDNEDDETTTTSSTSKTSTKFGSEMSQKGTETLASSPTSTYFTSSHLSSSITSSAPTAGPSACTLGFEIAGEEDLDVGDDGYDPSISDSVDCVPVIGAGGVASGCDNVQTKTKESITTGLEVTSNDASSTFLASSVTSASAMVVPFSTPPAEQSKRSSQLPDPTASTQMPTTCMPDGTPGMYPTRWCDCGTAKYTMTPECIFTNLPSNPLTPMTTTTTVPPPTNIPGPRNKLPASCTKYVATRQDYALGIIEDYCFCNGTLAPLLTHTISSSDNKVFVVTDCSYDLQPTNTTWSPSTTTLAPSLAPTTMIKAIITSTTTTTPSLYPITTVLVLVTTLLPPTGRSTVYSTVSITDVLSSSSSTSTTPAIIRPTFSAFSKCTNDFVDVDEAKCWANCAGGTCEANHNPFLNSQPWWVCGGCQ